MGRSVDHLAWRLPAVFVLCNLQHFGESFQTSPRLPKQQQQQRVSIPPPLSFYNHPHQQYDQSSSITTGNPRTASNTANKRRRWSTFKDAVSDFLNMFDEEEMVEDVVKKRRAAQKAAEEGKLSPVKQTQNARKPTPLDSDALKSVSSNSGNENKNNKEKQLISQLGSTIPLSGADDVVNLLQTSTSDPALARVTAATKSIMNSSKKPNTSQKRGSSSASMTVNNKKENVSKPQLQNKRAIPPPPPQKPPMQGRRFQSPNDETNEARLLREQRQRELLQNLQKNQPSAAETSAGNNVQQQHQRQQVSAAAASTPNQGNVRAAPYNATSETPTTLPFLSDEEMKSQNPAWDVADRRAVGRTFQAPSSVRNPPTPARMAPPPAINAPQVAQRPVAAPRPAPAPQGRNSPGMFPFLSPSEVARKFSSSGMEGAGPSSQAPPQMGARSAAVDPNSNTGNFMSRDDRSRMFPSPSASSDWPAPPPAAAMAPPRPAPISSGPRPHANDPKSPGMVSFMSDDDRSRLFPPNGAPAVSQEPTLASQGFISHGSQMNPAAMNGYAQQQQRPQPPPMDPQAAAARNEMPDAFDNFMGNAPPKAAMETTDDSSMGGAVGSREEELPAAFANWKEANHEEEPPNEPVMDDITEARASGEKGKAPARGLSMSASDRATLFPKRRRGGTKGTSFGKKPAASAKLGVPKVAKSNPSGAKSGARPQCASTPKAARAPPQPDGSGVPQQDAGGMSEQGAPQYDGMLQQGTQQYDGMPQQGTQQYDGMPQQGTQQYDGMPQQGTQQYVGMPMGPGGGQPPVSMQMPPPQQAGGLGGSAPATPSSSPYGTLPPANDSRSPGMVAFASREDRAAMFPGLLSTGGGPAPYPSPPPPNPIQSQASAPEFQQPVESYDAPSPYGAQPPATDSRSPGMVSFLSNSDRAAMFPGQQSQSMAVPPPLSPPIIPRPQHQGVSGIGQGTASDPAPKPPPKSRGSDNASVARSFARSQAFVDGDLTDSYSGETVSQGLDVLPNSFSQWLAESKASKKKQRRNQIASDESQDSKATSTPDIPLPNAGIPDQARSPDPVANAGAKEETQQPDPSQISSPYGSRPQSNDPKSPGMVSFLSDSDGYVASKAIPLGTFGPSQPQGESSSVYSQGGTGDGGMSASMGGTRPVSNDPRSPDMFAFMSDTERQGMFPGRQLNAMKPSQEKFGGSTAPYAVPISARAQTTTPAKRDSTGITRESSEVGRSSPARSPLFFANSTTIDSNTRQGGTEPNIESNGVSQRPATEKSFVHNKELYARRNANIVAEAQSEKGSRRWGIMEPRRVFEAEPGRLDPLATPAPAAKRADDWQLLTAVEIMSSIERAPSEEVPSEGRQRNLGTKVYSQRNFRVVASEMAGKSRWGAMESKRIRNGNVGKLDYVPMPPPMPKQQDEWATYSAGLERKPETRPVPPEVFRPNLAKEWSTMNREKTSAKPLPDFYSVAVSMAEFARKASQVIFESGIERHVAAQYKKQKPESATFPPVQYEESDENAEEDMGIQGSNMDSIALSGADLSALSQSVDTVTESASPQKASTTYKDLVDQWNEQKARNEGPSSVRWISNESSNDFSALSQSGVQELTNQWKSMNKANDETDRSSSLQLPTVPPLVNSLPSNPVTVSDTVNSVDASSVYEELARSWKEMNKEKDSAHSAAMQSEYVANSEPGWESSESTGSVMQQVESLDRRESFQTQTDDIEYGRVDNLTPPTQGNAVDAAIASVSSRTPLGSFRVSRVEPSRGRLNWSNVEIAEDGSACTVLAVGQPYSFGKASLRTNGNLLEIPCDNLAETPRRANHRRRRPAFYVIARPDPLRNAEYAVSRVLRDREGTFSNQIVCGFSEEMGFVPIENLVMPPEPADSSQSELPNPVHAEGCIHVDEEVLDTKHDFGAAFPAIPHDAGAVADELDDLQEASSSLQDVWSQLNKDTDDNDTSAAGWEAPQQVLLDTPAVPPMNLQDALLVPQKNLRDVLAPPEPWDEPAASSPLFDTSRGTLLANGNSSHMSSSAPVYGMSNVHDNNTHSKIPPPLSPPPQTPIASETPPPVQDPYAGLAAEWSQINSDKQ